MLQIHSSEQVSHSVDRSWFLKQLRLILPEKAILSAPEDLRPYECDGLSAYRVLPWLVVLPDQIGQVQAVMRLCQQTGVPLVTRGAGTGLSGGALPVENGVLLSVARMNRILSVSQADRTAVVQPGVRNRAVSEAVAHLGLYYAPDPSSQIACSIGGNVAENSGGVHCLKYGLTVHNITRIKMVTLDGELLTIGGSGLDGPGYDLLALVTGSEGMLGVIVEITVRLLPIPQNTQVTMASFASVEDAGNAVAAVVAAGLIPAGLELMDHASLCAAEDFVHAGYPVDAAAILLCEMDGVTAQVEDDLDRVERILRSQGATDVYRATDEADRQRLWAGRKAAFPAVGRISPDYYCMDGTIPRKHLATVLARIESLSDEYGLAVANVFHAGDGNLHPLILYDANNPGELEKAEALGGEILACCVEVGGTITGEHGVGMEKINQMCLQFTEAELQQFHAVKAAFDPDGLLNPGKAIPTLHRCAEFGAMHVHGGQLPHPELERF